jgi:hypothetical protein
LCAYPEAFFATPMLCSCHGTGTCVATGRRARRKGKE